MSMPASSSVYTDFSQFADLRAKAKKDSPEALRAVAGQFEALFVQMMLKSMRDASLAEGVMDNDQSKFYQEMFDQQIALDLSKGKGVGLADTLVRQLAGLSPDEKSTQVVPLEGGLRRYAGIANSALSNGAPIVRLGSPWQAASPDEFVTKLWPHAQRAGKALGVDAKALLAQSALETGWGRSVMKHPNGDSSHNLFGIKADNRWQGDRVNVSTLEFEGGVAVRQRAAFRAYASPAESFTDYVNFLRANPRYAETLQHAGDGNAFVGELQKAGYATDPEYANKIRTIMNSDRFTEAMVRVQTTQVGPLSSGPETGPSAAANAPATALDKALISGQES